jgi:hypothetical protein
MLLSLGESDITAQLSQSQLQQLNNDDAEIDNEAKNACYVDNNQSFLPGITIVWLLL